MNQQEVRHQLAEAIRRRWVLRGDARADDFAAELMPAVRSIVAKELRAIAYAHRGGSGDMDVYELLERASDICCDNCGGDPDRCDCDES